MAGSALWIGVDCDEAARRSGDTGFILAESFFEPPPEEDLRHWNEDGE